MVVFPNSKINLGLRVVEKRSDGYHNIETVFYPLPLKDALEFIPCGNATTANELKLFATGKTIPGNTQNNLCFSAWNLLKQNYPALPAVHIHLHKAIPAGGGLGGGSSNGAFTLKALNELFDLNISQDDLRAFALHLGSDCPFFLLNKPCLATSRGEIMSELELKLDDYFVVLILPGIHVNTGWAFNQIAEQVNKQKPLKTLEEIITLPVSEWRNYLANDFEAPVFSLYPELEKTKTSLYEAGAAYAGMTGTGSTIYGIFSRNTILSLPSFEPGWQVINLKQLN